MDEAPPPPPPPPRRRRRALRAIGGAVVLVLIVLGLVGVTIDSDAGHRFIADRIAELRPASGLRIHVGRIDGSIWRHARIRDLRLSDPQGVFLEAPSVTLDWRPGRWFANRLHVDRLASDLVVLTRLPRLHPGRGEGPILPDYAIHLGRVDLRIRLEPGIAGPRRLVHVVGHADTARGRAVIGLAARTSAGDRLTMRLDTEPDRDVFDLDTSLVSPRGGVVPGLFGSARTAIVSVTGQGRWHGWHGRGVMRVGGVRIADLALSQAGGRYALSGRVTPGSITQGKLQRLTTPGIAVAGAASYRDRRVAGTLHLRSPALAATARGTIDLARGAFAPLRIDIALLRPASLFPNMTGSDIRLAAVLDGAFRRAAFRYALTAPRIAFDQTGFEAVRAAGAGHIGGAAPTLPIRLTAARVTGAGAQAGGILGDLSVAGVLKVTSRLLTGDGLTLRSDRLDGRLGLLVDLVTGTYAVDVSGGLARYLIPNLGIVDLLTELKVTPTVDGHAAIVAGRARAWVRRFDNAFLRSLAGGLPSLDTQLVRAPDGSVRFSGLTLTAPALRIVGAGTRARDGGIAFTGTGTQTAYGAFRLGLDGMIDHPRIRLLLDRPVPALGLAGVDAALDPIDGGFAIHAAGGSTLGPFTARGAILTPPSAPATIRIDALDVTGTSASGTLVAEGAGVRGRLGVAGGGLGGGIDFATAGQRQRIMLHLGLADAALAGDAAMRVRKGNADADVLLDPAGARIDATLIAQGLRRGSIFLARTAINARLAAGRGTVRASVAGSRGKAFAFQTQIAVAPDAYELRGAGQIDGSPVTLTSPARLTRIGPNDGGGWRLSPTALSYGGGSATVAGRFGGSADALDATLSAIPLTALDIVRPGLGLSGAATGRLTYSRPSPAALPDGRATLRIRGLSRAGLVLSSTPVDVGVDALLKGDRAALRAIATSGSQVIGRAQAALGPLPASGTLAERIAHAALFGQLRYTGPADTLWRLTGIETIDLSGPIAVGADAGGTVDRPIIKGSLATAALRLESATLGTVVEGIHALGRFDGSRLVVDRFSGSTRKGGTLTGRAAFDFAAPHGLGIDIALDAKQAILLARDDIGATVTGPLTLKSDGAGGTIAGAVTLDRSNYRFGQAAAAGVPRLAVAEINRPADIDVAAPPMPWTLDLKVDAPNSLFVRGLGLDSEWRTKLVIKGPVDDPAIGGRADLIRGNYQFAGRRFDLSRGIIRFTGSQPVDPALDLVADANIQGLSAAIRVTGTGSRPELDFTSTPALPEDELLSRLLFGTSIANLSAPEALQLAAAVNSLRTGGAKGSLDPINAIRRVAGLDRLRIESADVTTGQKTSIAAGKYIGRKTYVELVTDGQGYSASRLEFQVTRWLSLLATISTIGRQSATVRISKDY